MGQHTDAIARRSFLLGSLAASAAVSAARISAAETKSDAGQVGLREKFFGCIAGCHIGSAMGAPVEGWSYERIEREHGLLDKLLPYSHYGKKDWVREPGTTEDGVERQKLMITAILEKQDRINAEDLRRAWVDHMNPNAAGLVSEPFEGALLAMAKTHIPASRHRQVLRLLGPRVAFPFLPSHRPDQRGRHPGRHRRRPRGRPALQHREQPGHPLGGGHRHGHRRRHEARGDGRQRDRGRLRQLRQGGHAVLPAGGHPRRARSSAEADGRLRRCSRHAAQVRLDLQRQRHRLRPQLRQRDRHQGDLRPAG